MKENKKVKNVKNYNKTKRGSKQRLKKIRRDNSISPVRRKYKTIENSDIIPLVNGEYEWNVFNVDNKILHHTAEDGHHPALVLLEYKGKLLLAEVTHSTGKKRLRITNPYSKDNKLSLIKRETVIFTNKNKTNPILVCHLMEKRNDVFFSVQEKKKILESLNNKNINIRNFKILINL